MNNKRTSTKVYIFLIIASVVAMFPFIWMLLSAFKETAEIAKIPPTFLPKNIYFGGFKKLFVESAILTWFFNSIKVSVSVTAVVLFTSSLIGYIFAKYEFKGKKIYFILVIATLMVPFQVVMIPVYLIVSKLGLINTLGALMVPSLVSAFGIFLCRQFIESLPNDLIHSGRVDGASEFTIYRSIILPEIKPTLSALAIFVFMGKWNDYLWPLISINDMGKMTIPLALNYFNSQYGKELNTVMAACAVIIIPEIIIYLIFQKQFIEGIAISGLK